MTSFVVAASSDKKRDVQISDLCQKLAIDPLDITFIEKESSKNTNSIGIEEVKNLHTKIFLKPVHSQTKAIILKDAELLTTEAQNALLKVLEEPPDNTIIILSVDNKHALLPTILSRCQIIELQTDVVSLSDEEKAEYLSFIESLPTMKMGERLKKAESLAKNKDEAILFIEKVILVLREKMINGDTDKKLDLLQIKSFQKLHTLLKTTNVNTRFAIENALLSLYDTIS